MARQVFFSFHYAQDLWRANVVRNSDTVRRAETEVGHFDHSLWEEAKTSGEKAIKALIDEGLNGASVTIALIGAETYTRRWCLYELAESHNVGKGLLGIRIDNIRNQAQLTSTPGPDPFVPGLREQPIPAALERAGAPVYQWNPRRFAAWVQAAAAAAR